MAHGPDSIQTDMDIDARRKNGLDSHVYTLGTTPLENIHLERISESV